MTNISKKRTNLNNEGYALIFVLILLIIVGILMGTLAMKLYFSKQNQMNYIKSVILENNIINGVSYIKNNGFVNKKVKLDKRQGFEVNSKDFGFFKKVAITSYFDNYTKKNILLMGVSLNKQVNHNIVMELGLSPYPIKFGKNFKTNGKIQIPPSLLGYRKNINNRLKFLEPNKQAYWSKNFNYKQYLNTINKLRQIETTNRLNIEKEIYLKGKTFATANLQLSPFLCKKIVGPGTIAVDGNIEISGNILITNFTTIIADTVTIHNNAILDGLIVVANNIELKDNVKGNGQFIAIENLNVKNCTLFRGSLLTVKSKLINKKLQGTLTVTDSYISGCLLMPLPNTKQNPLVSFKMVNSNFEGFVYLEGENEFINSNIAGTGYCSILVKKTEYVTKQNLLDNMNLNKAKKTLFLPICVNSNIPGEELYVSY